MTSMTRFQRGTTHLYRAFIGDRLAYVGITRNTAGRFSKHRCYKPWWKDVTRIEIETFESRTEALHAETIAISVENPVYNIARPRVDV